MNLGHTAEKTEELARGNPSAPNIRTTYKPGYSIALHENSTIPTKSQTYTSRVAAIIVTMAFHYKPSNIPFNYKTLV